MSVVDDDGRSSREPFSSNIMNYLVWRYLQEAGFAMAATWMGREWHKDPDEKMPFAKHVRNSQLIHMMQDSLFLDDVRARGDRLKHRYFFGDDHGPVFAQPVYDIAGQRKAIDAAKPGDHSMLNGNSDDPLLRRIKRRKASSRRVNGDAMDVDDGFTQSDQVSEIDSPAPAVQDVPLLETLAITEDRSVCTEKPRDLLPNTIFLEWPERQSISHSLWSTTEPGPLLIGGTNTLKLFGVRSGGQDVVQRGIDPNLTDYEVEALCWLGHSQAVASVVDKKVSGSEDEPTRKLVFSNNWASGTPQVIEAATGVTFALRYNTETDQLLTISGGGNITTISLLRISNGQATLLCSKVLADNALLDATWMTETKFIACGTNILQIYEVIESTERSFETKLIQTHDMRKSWFRIKYDPVCEIAVILDEEQCILRQYNVTTEDTKTQAFTDSTITDFAFQPIPNPDSYNPTTTPRLLATSTIDGTIQLWDVLRPFTCVHKLSLPAYGDSITMMQISFSPDGYLLAGAGFDTVAVWRPEEGGQPKALWRCTDLDQWHSSPSEAEESEDDWVHALDWDVHGQRLIFSLRDQAAVIKFS